MATRKGAYGGEDVVEEGTANPEAIRLSSVSASAGKEERKEEKAPTHSAQPIIGVMHPCTVVTFAPSWMREVQSPLVAVEGLKRPAEEALK